MKLDIELAKDHLKVGMPVVVDGFEGKVSKVEAGQVDVEIERPNALLINHYTLDSPAIFEVDEAKTEFIKDKAELERRCTILDARKDDLISILMDEIEELRSRIISLENVV